MEDYQYEEYNYKQEVNRFIKRKELDLLQKQRQYRNEKTRELQQWYKNQFLLQGTEGRKRAEIEAEYKDKEKHIEAVISQMKRIGEEDIKEKKLQIDIYGLQYVLDRENDYVEDEDGFMKKFIIGFIVCALAITVI